MTARVPGEIAVGTGVQLALSTTSGYEGVMAVLMGLVAIAFLWLGWLTPLIRRLVGWIVAPFA